VCVWFRQQPQEFYGTGFQGLVKRWDKCLNLFEDYIEKKNVICMSLSPLVSFKSRFVTYLLNFPRTDFVRKYSWVRLTTDSEFV